VRVLVTGGLGFLGRALTASLLDHGHEVTVLSRRDAASPAKLVRADLRDRAGLTEALAGLALEAVCHLAALTNVRDSFADPLGYYDTNLGGTLNLLRALPADRPVRIVVSSTSVVYGSGHDGRLGEDLDFHPESPYAETKVAVEQLVARCAATGAVGATALRCFNIAGAHAGVAGGNPTRIITAALRAAAGEIPHVTVNGDGSATREFTHVLDVAEAFRLALDATTPGAHRVFNVGTGEGHRMSDVIRTAEQVTGRAVPVRHGPPVREAHTLVCDPGRIRAALGWAPAHSALERIVADEWRGFS